MEIVKVHYANTLILIAPAKHEAQYWAQQWGLPPKQWKWVSNPQQMRGLRNTSYRWVGTPFEKYETEEEIFHLLKLQNWKEIPISDIFSFKKYRRHDNEYKHKHKAKSD